MGTGATNMSTTQQPEALAADHSEQNLEMVARWYMIDKDGMATLCTDREDAEKEAKDANMAWPHTAPHRAVQLVDVASVAASAGSEPVARVNDDGFIVEIGDLLLTPGQKLYLHPFPPGGMAGWKLVPVEPTEEMLAAAHDGDREYTLRNFGDVMTVMQGPYDHWAAMIDAAPPPPTTSAGSGKGE